MPANNYFFIDGSALLGDIKRLRKADLRFDGKKLAIRSFVQFFTAKLGHYHEGSWRRFVFYFVENDVRVADSLVLPDHTQPGEVNDLRIEYCGKRIKEFEVAQRWLDENNAPQDVREHFYRSEKAVDTQVCCDALQLAASGKLDRLFLYTNDFDFVPLCRALRQLGCNVNLLRLQADNVNRDLVRECDAFDVLDAYWLAQCFGVNPNPPAPADPAGAPPAPP